MSSYKQARQTQWGSRQDIPQGSTAPVRLVSVHIDDDDESAPIRGYVVTCSRNMFAGPTIPVYRIVQGTGATTFEWTALAPGTYIVYSHSIDVYVDGQVGGGAMRVQAWAGHTSAAPTLVLP